MYLKGWKTYKKAKNEVKIAKMKKYFRVENCKIVKDELKGSVTIGIFRRK